MADQSWHPENPEGGKLVPTNFGNFELKLCEGMLESLKKQILELVTHFGITEIGAINQLFQVIKNLQTAKLVLARMNLEKDYLQNNQTTEIPQEVQELFQRNVEQAQQQEILNEQLELVRQNWDYAYLQTLKKAYRGCMTIIAHFRNNPEFSKSKQVEEINELVNYLYKSSDQDVCNLLIKTWEAYNKQVVAESEKVTFLLAILKSKKDGKFKDLTIYEIMEIQLQTDIADLKSKIAIQKMILELLQHYSVIFERDENKLGSTNLTFHDFIIFSISHEQSQIDTLVAQKVSENQQIVETNKQIRIDNLNRSLAIPQVTIEQATKPNNTTSEIVQERILVPESFEEFNRFGQLLQNWIKANLPSKTYKHSTYYALDQETVNNYKSTDELDDIFGSDTTYTDNYHRINSNKKRPEVNYEGIIYIESKSNDVRFYQRGARCLPICIQFPINSQKADGLTLLIKHPTNPKKYSIFMENWGNITGINIYKFSTTDSEVLFMLHDQPDFPGSANNLAEIYFKVREELLKFGFREEIIKELEVQAYQRNI